MGRKLLLQLRPLPLRHDSHGVVRWSPRHHQQKTESRHLLPLPQEREAGEGEGRQYLQEMMGRQEMPVAQS